MNIITAIASILILIGAINWGLVGLFKFNLVKFIFKGDNSIWARLIYMLIGLSGLYTIIYLLI